MPDEIRTVVLTAMGVMALMAGVLIGMDIQEYLDKPKIDVTKVHKYDMEQQAVKSCRAAAKVINELMSP